MFSAVIVTGALTSSARPTQFIVTCIIVAGAFLCPLLPVFMQLCCHLATLTPSGDVVIQQTKVHP